MTNRQRGPLRRFARPLLQMQTGFRATISHVLRAIAAMSKSLLLGTWTAFPH
jgi:hypothetical protein